MTRRARSPGTVPMAMAELSLLHDIDALLAQPQPTGISELDRVLGGGLVPGSVTLLGGEPGIGKSTLLLQLLAWWPGPTLYISAEESPQQVRLRAERLGAVRPELWLAAETSLAGVIDAIDRTSPGLVVVDSIQTIADRRLTSSPGSVAQVRECAQQLVVEAKRRGVAIVLVGHVTKDGSLAGPRVLEHVVDTVLSFEGERHHALRLLRAVKHRFGSTDELGLFEMTGQGLTGVPDPSKLFLADRRVGRARFGRRPGDGGPAPAADRGPGAHRRRSRRARRPGATPRGSTAVAWPCCSPCSSGGPGSASPTRTSTRPPSAACASSSPASTSPSPSPWPAPSSTTRSPGEIVMGEIGLGGEVRQVSHAKRRLGEAVRMGFRRAIVPASSPACDGIELVRVRTVSDALGRHRHRVARSGGRRMR